MILKDSKVYLVIEYDIDISYICGIYSSLERAESAILTERNRLVEEWNQIINVLNKEKTPWKDNRNMYKKFISDLSGDDWKKWNNDNHKCLKIIEYEVK